MRKFIPLLLASNDNNNNIIYKNDLGSYVIIEFKPPIYIPNNIETCWIEIISALISNSSPNIISGQNDKFYFGTNLGDDYTATIPEGYYNAESLETAMNLAIYNALGSEDAIELHSIHSTGKTELIINKFGLYIDFTPSDTFSEIIGFDTLIDFALLVPVHHISNNVSEYNTDSVYRIHSDITTGGIPVNDDSQQIIAKIVTNESTIGTQVSYRPSYKQKIVCNNLIGATIHQIKLWLTNKHNQLVNTVNENFSIELSLNYM